MNDTADDSSRWEIIGQKGQWQIRHINPCSDGEQRQWPGKPYRPSSEERYLIQLGKAWVEKDGLQMPGLEYYIDKLPDGYALFEVDQQNGTQVYKRLFGHPTGKYYDSILKFQVHFLWLMSDMQGNCECVHCGNYRPKPSILRMRNPIEKSLVARERRTNLPGVDSAPSTRSNSASDRALGAAPMRPQRQVRAAGAPYAQDEEGNEDVYKDALKRLEAQKGSRVAMKDDIREENSFDWRAEHCWRDLGSDLLQRSLTLIEHQHVFVPRRGELVLFCADFLDEHYLMLDNDKHEYKFYSFDQKRFHGFPAWRGGVIADVPSSSGTYGTADFPDIQDLPEKRSSLNTSGFRVETFPDPNNEIDKKASKQYRYLPLRNIRPLSHWQMLLRGIPREKWHPSIEYCLTCMTSISLLEKFELRGDWPAAHIRCKGIYIGAELIIVGDTVRMIPPDDSVTKMAMTCTDVLVVDSIRLNLIDIQPDHVLPYSPLLSEHLSITLVGRAYTLDRNRRFEMPPVDGNADLEVDPSLVPQEEVKTVFRPVGTGDYGDWYYLHHPRQRYEVSYDQVLGRLYEAAAVQLWTGQLQTKRPRGEYRHIKPSLGFDMKAIEEGRRYATQTDERLEEAPEGQLLWFWADTRAEALDIETINGEQVGRYDDLRDKDTLEVWRTHIKLLNGHTVPTDSLLQYQYVSKFPPDIFGQARGRKPGSKVVNGKVIMPGAPGYDEAVSDERHAARQPTPKHKSSQLASAALNSTDEESGDDVFEDAQEVRKSVEAGDTGDVTMQDQSPTIPKPKKPRTKTQIMEDAAAEDNYYSEDEWYNEPLPVRGGTEETEGGDYDPHSRDD